MLVIPDVNKKMTSFRGQAGWTKMTSSVGKLTALAYHTTKSKQSRVTNLYDNELRFGYQYSLLGLHSQLSLN